MSKIKQVNEFSDRLLKYWNKTLKALSETKFLIIFRLIRIVFRSENLPKWEKSSKKLVNKWNLINSLFVLQNLINSIYRETDKESISVL